MTMGEGETMWDIAYRTWLLMSTLTKEEIAKIIEVYYDSYPHDTERRRNEANSSLQRNEATSQRETGPTDSADR